MEEAACTLPGVIASRRAPSANQMNASSVRQSRENLHIGGGNSGKDIPMLVDTTRPRSKSNFEESSKAATLTSKPLKAATVAKILPRETQAAKTRQKKISSVLMSQTMKPPQIGLSADEHAVDTDSTPSSKQSLVLPKGSAISFSKSLTSTPRNNANTATRSKNGDSPQQPQLIRTESVPVCTPRTLRSETESTPRNTAGGDTTLIKKAESIVSQRLGLQKEEVIAAGSSSMAKASLSNPSSAEKMRPKLILASSLGDVDHVTVTEPIDTNRLRKKSSITADSDVPQGLVKDLPPSVTNGNRIVINNEELAKKNDAILQTKLMEAKAMSRRDGSGAAMFKFSLWDRAQGTQQQNLQSGVSPFKTTVNSDSSVSAEPKYGPTELTTLKKTTIIAEEALAISETETFDITQASPARAVNSVSRFVSKLSDDISKYACATTPSPDAQNTVVANMFPEIQADTLSNIIDSGAQQQISSNTESLPSFLRNLVGNAKSTVGSLVSEISQDNESEEVQTRYENDPFHCDNDDILSVFSGQTIESNQPLPRKYGNSDNNSTTDEVEEDEDLKIAIGRAAASKISSDTSTIDMTLKQESTTSSPRRALTIPLKFTWKRGQMIGEGSFGRVYKGLNENTGELIAVKQFSLVDGSEAEIETFRREIEMMECLDHKNIVRYLGTDRTHQHLFILLEFVSGGSIEQMLSQFGPFSEDLIRKFTHHIICGVVYLHEKGIVHRDIKGANVLVSSAGIAKLADFGCSKKLSGMFTASLEDSMRAMRGSVQWMAPEVIKQTGSGRLSDIWSLGATVIEMASGLPPWSEFSNNLATLFHVATSNKPPEAPETLSSAAKDFLSKCLVIDPSYRQTGKELLNMRWFEGITEGPIDLQPLTPRRSP